MKKVLFQGIVTIGLFLVTFFLFYQINWMKILNVEHVSKSVDEKLGELYWELFRSSNKEIKDSTITNAIDSLLFEICNSNKIDKNKIKLHLLKNNEINAFALPDDHIVIYSGLILASDNQSELCGVLCHELAHVKRNHVMKKLIKEFGLSTLFSMTTGGGDNKVTEMAKFLSSTAYDRRLEDEADIDAVNFLIKTNIDPLALATFLYRLKDNKTSDFNSLSWISTHPDIDERVKNIITLGEQFNGSGEEIIANSTWKNLKECFKK